MEKRGMFETYPSLDKNKKINQRQAYYNRNLLKNGKFTTNQKLRKRQYQKQYKYKIKQ